MQCKIDGCDRSARYKDSQLCSMHYQRWWKHGSFEKLTQNPPAPGDVFGRLTFVGAVASGTHSRGIFTCDCGTTTKPIRIAHVTSGAQKSCGCLRLPKMVSCRIDGCGRDAYDKKNALCFAHYRRFKKYGDPTAGGIRYRAAQEFCEVAIAQNTDACIRWPYGRDSYGYGRINVGGTPQHVHAYIATRVHGPKPTPAHECCHSCGKGHEGCINPRHLYWGTRSDNVQDAIRHGTLWRGGSLSKARLLGRAPGPRSRGGGRSPPGRDEG